MNLKRPSRKDLESQLSNALKRIRAFELHFMETVSAPADMIESRHLGSVVHVVRGHGATSGSILGVFLLEQDASACVSENTGLWNDVNKEAWLVKEAEPEEYETPVEPFRLIYCAGQQVTYHDREKDLSGSGTIIADDNDDSLGEGKIIYYIVPLGLTMTMDNALTIYGEEITGLYTGE